MEIIILTGMSGAGKSLAADYLEDMGFFCIDNLPPRMVPDFVRVYANNQWQGSSQPDLSKTAAETAPATAATAAGLQGITGDDLASELAEPDLDTTGRLAFVIDVRSSDLFEGIFPALEKITQMGYTYRIIYLEATDAVLVSRYKQSRRNHPLARGRSLAQAIAIERVRLAPLKELASDVIETSNLAAFDLRNILYAMLSHTDRDERMTILIQSFGFKYGIPVDCDCIMDVRFIPNPFYVAELKDLSGLDEPVRQYVFSFPETHAFLDLQAQLLAYTIPYYIREGKVRLTIGVGCTGGRHRSVALAEALASRLLDNQLRIIVDHRDLEKDPRRNRLRRT